MASILSVTSAGADSAIEARFRGCESTGVCQFWFERPEDGAPALHRVLPDGIGGQAAGAALRDRLNALLSDMIHQHKRIELRHLRERADGLLTAQVTVTGVALLDDPALKALLAAPGER